MAHIDLQYNKLAEEILHNGFFYKDASRNNMELLQIPHYTLDIDMHRGFPLLTTKKIFWKSCIHELIWMLSGSTNINYLIENNVHIWDKDAFGWSGSSYIGRMYGYQWRNWQGWYDQIHRVIDSIKDDIYTRGHLVSAWNPAEFYDMALRPCHWAFEILPMGTGFALKWHQRSTDAFLGLPFDITLYALLGKIIEKEIGLPFNNLIGDLSNIHFYGPHIPLIKEQLKRPTTEQAPYLRIDNYRDYNNLSINNFIVEQYTPHPAIKAIMYSKNENSKD